MSGFTADDFIVKMGGEACYRKLTGAHLDRLSIAIEQASDSIIIVGTDGLILYANLASKVLTGYTLDELVGQHVRALCSPRYERIFYLDLWNHVLSGEVWRGRLQNQHKDGAWYEVLATFSPVRGRDGTLLYVVIDSRDITREVELESQLHHSQRMEAIGVLAGGIAHDFNNILTPILGYTEMGLLLAGENSRLEGYLKEILSAGRRASALVDQILTFSRQGESIKKPVLLAPIVKETLKLMRAALPQTISIHQDLEASTHPIWADPSHLHQVVLNLCTNAFKAMQDMGGALEVRVFPVHFSEPASFQGVELRPGGYVCLQVSDTGQGMNEDTLKKAFLPFFTTRNTGEGTGLGLSIVHGIVLSLDGGIDVQSEVGGGTTFSLYFPEAYEEAGDVLYSTRSPLRGQGRILIVDDEPSIGNLMKEILGALGYQVTVTDSGVTALAALKLVERPYDLIISDMTMPGWTGLELLAQVRSAGFSLPFILMTGFSQKLEEFTGEGLCPTAILKKPVNITVLAELLREWVTGSTQGE